MAGSEPCDNLRPSAAAKTLPSARGAGLRRLDLDTILQVTESLASETRERWKAMAQVTGENKSGGPRVLDCRIEGDRAYLWIHSPDSSENGWEIRVDAAEFMAAIWGDRILGSAVSQT